MKHSELTNYLFLGIASGMLQEFARIEATSSPVKMNIFRKRETGVSKNRVSRPKLSPAT